MQIPDATTVTPDFAGLAHDLEAAWNAPGVTMRTRQRLLRALVTDIIADVDDATREVVLTTIGAVASTHNCGSASRSPASTAAGPLTRPSP
jgi:hypothetical protein